MKTYSKQDVNLLKQEKVSKKASSSVKTATKTRPEEAEEGTCKLEKAAIAQALHRQMPETTENCAGVVPGVARTLHGNCSEAISGTLSSITAEQRQSLRSFAEILYVLYKQSFAHED